MEARKSFMENMAIKKKEFWRHKNVFVTGCTGFLGSYLNNESPVIRSDGTFVRDYLYVENAVQAYLLLAAKMEDSSLAGEAFNFSHEIQLTVLDLVKKILKLMNSDLHPVILNQGSNEIKHQYLSAKKARNILGWKPVYDLDEGLKKTIDWYKDFFKSGSRYGEK